jgi:hypothetical protein
MASNLREVHGLSSVSVSNMRLKLEKAQEWEMRMVILLR